MSRQNYTRIAWYTKLDSQWKWLSDHNILKSSTKGLRKKIYNLCTPEGVAEWENRNSPQSQNSLFKKKEVKQPIESSELPEKKGIHAMEQPAQTIQRTIIVEQVLSPNQKLFKMEVDLRDSVFQTLSCIDLMDTANAVKQLQESLQKMQQIDILQKAQKLD